MRISALCLSRGNQSMVDAAYADWCEHGMGDEFVVACDEGSGVRVPEVRVEVPRGINLGAKRNAALRAATGNVIVVWDDDDGHAPRRVQTQIEAICAGYDATTLCEVMLEADGRESLVASMPCGWPQTLAIRRRSLIGLGGWPETGRYDSDMALLMRIHGSCKTQRIRCETPLYTYRQHGENVMGSRHWESIRRRAMTLETWRRVFRGGMSAEKQANVA